MRGRTTQTIAYPSAICALNWSNLADQVKVNKANPREDGKGFSTYCYVHRGPEYSRSRVSVATYHLTWSSVKWNLGVVYSGLGPRVGSARREGGHVRRFLINETYPLIEVRDKTSIVHTVSKQGTRKAVPMCLFKWQLFLINELFHEISDCSHILPVINVFYYITLVTRQYRRIHLHHYTCILKL